MPTKSLVDVLRAYALSHPDSIPFTYLADGEQEEQDLTYAEFDQKSRKIAASLQAHQLEGERVLLLFPQGLEYLIALFGCFYAGVIAVPAYPPRNNRNLQRLLSIMADCDARYFLTDRSGALHLEKMKRQDFSGYQFLVYENLVDTNADWKERPIESEDIAYLQYTSGSTGNPKGVIIRHKNMLTNVKQCERSYSDDMYRAFNWIPMYHDMGLISMMCYFTRNARCYFMSPAHFLQKPLRWLQAISRYKIQFTLGPNFAFDLCCEKIDDNQREGLDLSTLKDVITGSERVRLPTMAAFYEKFKKCGFHIDAFIPSYGLAEATLIVTTTGPGCSPVIVPHQKIGQADELDTSALPLDQPEAYYVSNGPVVDEAEIEIVSPKTGLPLGEDEIGEIWVHSPNSVSDGYWNNEKESQEVFYNYLPDNNSKRYLRTGDLGFLHNGELFVTGRMKDMIIVRGSNYYPQDIEFVVQESHEALEQNAGAAFALETKGQEQMVVVQEVKRSAWRTADPDEAIEAIRQSIAQTFEIMPHRIVLIRPMSLPKTSSGKIQRNATRRQLLEDKLRVIKEWQPSSGKDDQTVEEIEAGQVDQQSILLWLQHKIAEKAEIPPQEISAAASVKEYPLESVDAVYITTELSDWLNVDLNADVFWAFDTIGEMVNFLHDKYQETHSG